MSIITCYILTVKTLAKINKDFLKKHVIIYKLMQMVDKGVSLCEL